MANTLTHLRQGRLRERTLIEAESLDSIPKIRAGTGAAVPCTQKLATRLLFEDNLIIDLFRFGSILQPRMLRSPLHSHSDLFHHNTKFRSDLFC